MSTQHTPGPWAITSEKPFVTAYCAQTDRPEVVATVYSHSGTAAEWLANARLIAAAPDLLAALYASKMALLSCMHANVLVDTAFDQVNAAIARATGKEGAK